jgi:2-polyprenyl-3-methyl-5-hydroxy-6-metoxy-1,4-benzoquinol methylase
MQSCDHWENVYQTKRFDALSWYAPHLAESLRLIEQLCSNKKAAIVDIGCGESTLVDDLLARQYLDVSVLDISATAIEFTKHRLASAAQHVNWYVADITQHDFGTKQFDLWHDRAVFHCLTDPIARQRYIDLVRRTVKPGGHVLMSTFGPDGPLKCSGLEVVRYSAQTLCDELGQGFSLQGSQLIQHRTPMGTEQQFLYGWFKVSA